MELWAISEALDIGLKIANPGTPITVFFDCQRAMRAIALLSKCQKNRFLRILVY